MQCSTRIDRTETSPDALRKEKIKTLLQDPTLALPMMAKRSLFALMRILWAEYSSEEFKPNWHIELICKELEQLARNVALGKAKAHDLIINIPPGTTKTATCMIFFPIWCWVNWYWMRFITVSYSSALSLESAEFSRDVIRSDRFKALFPELKIKDDKDNKSNYRIVMEERVRSGQACRIRNGGNRLSTSVGGTVTGFHAHIILWDDPLNPQQAISETELPKVNQWLDTTLSNRKVDKSVAPTVGIMQRLHQNDPTGHLLKKKAKKIRHICLPGEIEGYREMVQPKTLLKYYKNNLLDPVRLSRDVLREMEVDLGQYGYAGQVGQSPTSPQGGMFKVDRMPIVEMVSPTLVEARVRYWDKAGSDGKGAYTVGLKMVRVQGDRFVIEDVKRGQWSSEVREEIILATARADGEDVQVYVEQEPGSGGKESAEGSMRRLALAGFTCSADLPTGDKVRRADPFSVMVNSGAVSLLRAEWNETLKEEMKNFPFSTYKDQVDAGSGAYARLISKRKARSW